MHQLRNAVFNKSSLHEPAETPTLALTLTVHWQLITCEEQSEPPEPHACLWGGWETLWPRASRLGDHASSHPARWNELSPRVV